MQEVWLLFGKRPPRHHTAPGWLPDCPASNKVASFTNITAVGQTNHSIRTAPLPGQCKYYVTIMSQCDLRIILGCGYLYLHRIGSNRVGCWFCAFLGVGEIVPYLQHLALSSHLPTWHPEPRALISNNLYLLLIAILKILNKGLKKLYFILYIKFLIAMSTNLAPSMLSSVSG